MRPYPLCPDPARLGGTNSRLAGSAAWVLALALLASTPVLAQDAPEPDPASAIPSETVATDGDQAPVPVESTAEPTTLAPTESGAPVDQVDAPPPAATPPAEVPPDAASSDARTDAEREYDALYGGDRSGGQYDPVADPTLPAPASITGTYDPWERFNRRVHRFNNVIDRRIALPLARAYVRVTPRPIRLGVSNFFSNLGQPVAAVNALLQGKPKQAAQSLGRFALNSTLGIGGVFDPASDTRLPNRSEDFGQTLGVWGWKRSRYVELPLFGPRTVRDVLGMVGDAPLSPLRQVDADRYRVPLQGLQLVDIRTQLLSTDSLREGAEDDYALVRDAWSQRRDYQIFGDRQLEGDDGLPDYLLDENNPTVPVDAMPLMPTGGG